MPELTDFPTELLESIVSTLDEDSLKALRSTCKKLSGFSNHLLFRSVSLYNTPDSCRLLQSILIQPYLREEVRNLNLNSVTEDYDTDEEDEVEPPSGWKEILEQMPTLPNLQSVALRFDKKCAADDLSAYVYAPQTERYRQTLLRWLFAPLTDLRPRLRELAIQNYQNVIPISRTVSSWVDEVLETLESLRLNVVHERDFAAPESEIEKNPVHDFFGRVLPFMWLKPSMASLRKLSLYSSIPWGFYPKVNMEDVHFPNLQSLTLGNFSFVNDDQLNWIREHSSTLEELYMDRCFIVFYVRISDQGNELERTPLAESDMETVEASSPRYTDRLIYHYPRRWHDYFASLHNGLPRLSQFGFGTSQSWKQKKMPFERRWNLVDELTQDRYCPFDGGFDCYPSIEWPDCYQEDLNALEALQQGIGQKAKLK